MRRVSTICASLIFVLASMSHVGAAERLVVSLSSQRVLINSVFSGAELVLFGAIERDRNAPERRFGYDITAIVAGPPQSLLTLRKEELAGIWVNVESRTFVNVPSYLAIFANRPFDQITSPEALRRLRIGFDNTIFRQQIGPDVADVVREDAFRQAFLRLKVQHRLYLKSPTAMTFLSPTLFRVSVPIPADASVGSYSVDVMLFADGALITRTTSAFEILKVGFEQFVVTAAREYGLLYGIFTVMMSLATGWFASIVFRRE